MTRHAQPRETRFNTWQVFWVGLFLFLTVVSVVGGLA